MKITLNKILLLFTILTLTSCSEQDSEKKHAAFYISCGILFVFPDLPQIINVSGIVTPIVSNPIIMLEHVHPAEVLKVIEHNSF